MKISKTAKAEARKHAQAVQLWQFIEVLRRAGNIVEEEVRFDMRPADSSQSPPIPRKWKFDVAMPAAKLRNGYTGRLSERVSAIAIEIEGYGRHQSMKGFTDDLDKYGEAFAQGWTLLRVSRAMIADGTALDLLARRGVRVEAQTSITDAAYRKLYGAVEPADRGKGEEG